MTHKINLFGPIGYWWKDTDHQAIANQLAGIDDKEPVEVHINSPGGSVFEGVGIYNSLRQHKGRVAVYVDALAASAASVIALAGDEIIMGEGSMMMIHNPWMITMADADGHRQSAEFLDKIRDALVETYVARTGKSEEELRDMLDAETWMTASEAVEHGFATRVDGDTPEDSVAALAQFDFHNSTQIPALLRDRVVAAVRKRESANITTQQATPRGADMTIEDKNKKPGNQAPVVEPKATTVDEDQIRADAKSAGIQAERQRQKEIRSAVKAAGLMDELGDELVDEGVSADVARKRIFNHLAEAGPAPTQNATPTGSGVQVGKTSDEKFGEGVKNMILARANIEKHDAQNNYNGYTMLEIARMSLERQGVNTRGMGKMQLVGAAFTMTPQASGAHTTSDFPSILSNSAHKAVMKGYDQAEETFQKWTVKGVLTDFKVHSRVDMNDFGSLRKVPEGAEFKNVSVGDRKELIQLATYGDVFPITRQAIINDDLRFFTRIPKRMGGSAKETVGDLVYAVLTSNPKMDDGTALFHSDHGNLGNTAFGIDSVAAGIVAMRTQKGRDSNKSLGIKPAYIITPAALELEARALIESEKEPGTENKKNKVANVAEVIGEHRLDDDSTDDWYMSADPARYDTVEVGYLDGNERPRVERQEDWKTDGVHFKVAIDATAKAMDWKTLRKEDVA